MIAFVILHYLSKEMTLKCVNTLEETFANDNYHIIIVDNASSNNSGEELKKELHNNNNCTVIVNEENLGFAKGNNVGYVYARKHYNPDFVVVMNNDVLIKDFNFLKKIEKIYEETDFYILGPDIYAPKKNQHQSPMRLTGYTYDEVRNIVSQREQWLKHYFVHYTKLHTKRLIKKLLKRKYTSPYKDLYKERSINSVLHGACYIFSKNFIQKEDLAFNPNTFLYMEEDILHCYCQKKGYLMVYEPEIKVEHMEDVSTDMAFNSDYTKRKMKYKNLVKSGKVLLDVIKN